MKRILSAGLCVLLLAAMAGCGAPMEEVPEGVTELTPPPTENAAQDSTPTPDAEGEPLTQEEIDALLNGPEWEGVYRKDDVTLVIRDRDQDFAVLILEAGEKGSFSGYVQVSREAVTYTGETFALTVTLAEDAGTALLALEGSFPVEGLEPAGSYERTQEDPLSYEAGIGADALPSSLSDTVLNGKMVTVYLDPRGRFSAVLPSVFTQAPADLQPEDGVRLTTPDGMARGAVYTEPTQWADAQAAADAAAELYENAEVYVDGGCAFVDRTFADEDGIRWGEVRILCPMGDTAAVLEYAWQIEGGAAYGAHTPVLAVSNS